MAIFKQILLQVWAIYFVVSIRLEIFYFICFVVKNFVMLLQKLIFHGFAMEQLLDKLEDQIHHLDFHYKLWIKTQELQRLIKIHLIDYQL